MECQNAMTHDITALRKVVLQKSTSFKEQKIISELVDNMVSDMKLKNIQ